MKKLYLDIETTGLSKHSDIITVVGMYDGKNVTQLVNGINLEFEEINKIISKSKTIITFNGQRFDMPFILHHFPELNVNHTEHEDLMYLGWSLGLKGGLKSIETHFDISRDSGITNGLEAVRLWHSYKKGNSNSLKKLLEYNREDIVNLEQIETLMNNMKNANSIKNQEIND
ncbi:MAG: ribonuclease H-like domain-containing protein [DPANN group archaeon]|nr:ribonuclease H-like domain-containing protein [DPANN group archaeon]